MYSENSFAEGYAIGRDSGNGNNCNNGWGADGAWWIVILLIFGWGGFGNGFGGFGNGGGYGVQADVQRSFDTSTIISKLDGINNGLCDGFYAQRTGLNGLQNSMNQGFAGTYNAIVQNGYENRLATQGLSSQVASCCCDLEKMNMQNRYDASQNTCATLQAIDKVGDRIINYLAADKAQALRDENQALRLAASQQAQNNYLVNQLRPCPVPAYITCNPYSYQYQGCNQGCGCNC